MQGHAISKMTNFQKKNPRTKLFTLKAQEAIQIEVIGEIGCLIEHCLVEQPQPQGRVADYVIERRRSSTVYLTHVSWPLCISKTQMV